MSVADSLEQESSGAAAGVGDLRDHLGTRCPQNTGERRETKGTGDRFQLLLSLFSLVVRSACSWGSRRRGFKSRQPDHANEGFELVSVQVRGYASRSRGGLLWPGGIRSRRHGVFLAHLTGAEWCSKPPPDPLRPAGVEDRAVARWVSSSCRRAKLEFLSRQRDLRAIGADGYAPTRWWGVASAVCYGVARRMKTLDGSLPCGIDHSGRKSVPSTSRPS